MGPVRRAARGVKSALIVRLSITGERFSREELGAGMTNEIVEDTDPQLAERRQRFPL